MIVDDGEERVGRIVDDGGGEQMTRRRDENWRTVVGVGERGGAVEEREIVELVGERDWDRRVTPGEEDLDPPKKELESWRRRSGSAEEGTRVLEKKIWIR